MAKARRAVTACVLIVAMGLLTFAHTSCQKAQKPEGRSREIAKAKGAEKQEHCVAPPVTDHPDIERKAGGQEASRRERVFGIDTHHRELREGSASTTMMVNFASGKGWAIKLVDVEPITSEYLRKQGVSVLCIEWVKIPFTEEELLEIVEFVRGGGGLLLQADHPSYGFAKEVAARFGTRVTENEVPRALRVNVSSKHPLLKDVNTFLVPHLGVGGEIAVYLDVAAPSQAILSAGLTEPYRPVIAAAEVGSGRVVIYPHSFSFTLKDGDNSYFLRNSLYWLQQQRLPGSE